MEEVFMSNEEHDPQRKLKVLQHPKRHWKYPQSLSIFWDQQVQFL